MAELFLAEDSRTKKLVCIKRILPYLAEEPEFVQMFLDEARIAAQLHHPNIVEVNELGKLGEHIFIAMEFCDGIDLRRILQQEARRQSAVPYAVASYIVARICEGLHYAHNRMGMDGRPMALIHRDISPQNVMVSYDGDVKLVDFGIAKASAVVERSKPGVIKGKYLYLAPEQLTQERLDNRADLFAVGSMLYEVTTGRSPFQKSTTEAVILAIRNEEPAPPHLVKNDYPLALSRIVMRCLQKDRTRRYQQAGEIQEELDDFVSQTLQINRDSLRTYVARTFGAEEDRTVVNLPERTAKKQQESYPEVTASTQSERPAPVVSKGPTRPFNDDEADPKTMTARPEDIARAFGTALMGPPRKRSGNYEAAGSGGDERTQMAPEQTRLGRPGEDDGRDDGSTSEVSQPTPSLAGGRVATPTFTPSAPSTPPPRKRPVSDAPPLPNEPSTARERPKKSGGSKAPPRPPRVREPDPDDEKSTADFRLPKLGRLMGQGEGRWAFLQSERTAAVAAVVLLLAGVIALTVLIVRRSQTPQPTQMDQQLDQETGDDAQVVIDDGPPITKPEKTLPAVVQDAGSADEDDVENAGVTVVVADPTPDAGTPPVKPPPNPPTKVPVVFRAPAGTEIRADGSKRTPGAQYRFKVGNLKYTYKCPKKGSRPLTAFERLSRSRSIEYISIKCPR